MKYAEHLFVLHQVYKDSLAKMRLQLGVDALVKVKADIVAIFRLCQSMTVARTATKL
jgi:hypothetical protein